MTTWTPQDLDRVGAAEDLQISARGTDGVLPPAVTVWGVRLGDEVYVRSAYGRANNWYKRALASGTGALRVPGIDCGVVFDAADPSVEDAVDDAYRAKYGRHGDTIEGDVVGEATHGLTLRVRPEA